MKALRVLAGATISLVSLFLAFRGVSFGDVGRAFVAANHGWLAVAVLLVIGSVVLRAIRWRALFADSRSLHTWNLFGTLNVGYLFNNILPFRAGEVVRVILLGEVEPVSRVEALSTVVVERVVDTLAVIALFVIVAPLVHVPAAAERPVLVLTVATGMLVLAMVLAVVRRPQAALLGTRLSYFLPSRFRSGLQRQGAAILNGLGALGRPLTAAKVIGLTLLVYLALGAAMEAQLVAFHVSVPTAAPLFLLAAATLGLIAPSPGAVGVWEGIMIAALAGIFAVDRALATSIALVTHAVFFAPPMILAAVYLWRLGVSWNRMVRLTGGRAEAQAVVSSD